MPITITIDKTPDGELELDLTARDSPEPGMLQIATALLTELLIHLRAHEDSPESQDVKH
mgnify:CR=1 FL=1